MRSLLVLLILALSLLGCQKLTAQWSNSPAMTAGPVSWNDRNSSPRPIYRQTLAQADVPPNFTRRRPTAADGPPYMAAEPAPWRDSDRYPRWAYRQALARADDFSYSREGPTMSDTADMEGPPPWSSRIDSPRRAQQALARADEMADFRRGRFAADDDASDDPESMEPWNNRIDSPRRVRQALARADAPSGFRRGPTASAAQWSNDGSSPLKTVTLRYGGYERSYLLYVPSGYRPGQPIPLVLVFHGGGGTASGIARTTNMHQLAERNTFIVIYPNGTGSQTDHRFTWNAGSSPPQGYAENENVDDVGFVKAILQQAKQSYTIDPKRIYATGLSKGAMFSYRLACELSDQFAAIAPVAGTLTYNSCRPTSPVAILHIHGSNDERVPLNGGVGQFSARNIPYPSSLQGLSKWRQINNCSITDPQTAMTPDTTRSAYRNCTNRADVVYYIVRGGGHGWPGSMPNLRQQREGSYISNQLHASDEIWKFFAAHPKS